MIVTAALGGASADEPTKDLPPSPKMSGREFMSAESRAQQDDQSVNPGMLWVEQGRALWSAPAGSEGRSCASCHGDVRSMAGVSARYPAFDIGLGRLLNVEARIEHCRTERQKAPPLGLESQELLALSALIGFQSRGTRIWPTIDRWTQPVLSRGRVLFHQRQGQLDLSCANCHDDSWGRRMRSSRLSQGQPTGYPLYRLEWQTMGSLHRRLRACMLGVRAEPFAAGSPELLALELYLAVRARGLLVETPAVRP